MRHYRVNGKDRTVSHGKIDPEKFRGFGLARGLYGMVTAPISIWLSTRISIRNGLLLVGLLIIITSINTLIGAFCEEFRST